VAAKEAKQKGAKVLAIANVIGSAIPRMADATLLHARRPRDRRGLHQVLQRPAGQPGACSPSGWGAAARPWRPSARASWWRRWPASRSKLADTLVGTRQLQANLARRYMEARDVLFLGRGLSFPIALEGALKLKEISYVHAEGYAAGEMKHGPIALIDSHVPVLVLVPRDDNYERSLSNLQEAKAREAMVIAIANEGDADAADRPTTWSRSRPWTRSSRRS
jgi:glucosamine--fructose-6-phosphate aminotransferase (isomerizing)